LIAILRARLHGSLRSQKGILPGSDDMQKRDESITAVAERKKRIVHSKKLIRESKVMIDYSQQIISNSQAKDRDKTKLNRQS
jgi:hypothetical protein